MYPGKQAEKYENHWCTFISHVSSSAFFLSNEKQNPVISPVIFLIFCSVYISQVKRVDWNDVHNWTSAGGSFIGTYW